MIYLEYNLHNGAVIKTHEEIPTINSTDYGYCKTDLFQLGDEFAYVITIDSVDEEGNMLGYSSFRNNPYAQRLLTENVQLKAENADLKERLAMSEEVIDFILMGGI